MLVSLKHYWLWDPIRDDARFQALYARMNFTHPAPAAATEPATTGDSGAPLTPAEIKRFLQELDRHMNQDRPYLDPALSLRQLAEELELHPNKLSWLLNEQVGQNFNEYVNGYRLATFKLIALEPANQHLTLLGLAYESGFNSKSVFNDFFKKREGLTPGAWVKAHKV